MTTSSGFEFFSFFVGEHKTEKYVSLQFLFALLNVKINIYYSIIGPTLYYSLPPKNCGNTDYSNNCFHENFIAFS